MIGAPGAGKSYKAVREIVFSVCNEARPVYTNVPIRPKKIRAYIYRKLPRSVRGHKARRARANLVQSITQQHFRYFCFRLSLIDAIAERVLDEMGGNKEELGKLAEFQQSEARNEAMRRVAEATPENLSTMLNVLKPVESTDREKYIKGIAHFERLKEAAHKIIGPPKISGRNANWIPPGSVLFLDELHKWFPSRDYRDEPKEILDFTSMHRHMQLKVFVMSQRWMNVSLSFRSMAREVWYCMNYAKQPILGFLRFDKWINVFRYVHYNAEFIEERTGLPGIGAKPVWSEMICPELSGGYEFDLYKSYSHAGTLEQQQQEIRRVTAAMIGLTQDELNNKTATKERADMPKRDTLGNKLNRWGWTAGLVGIALLAGMWWSRSDEPQVAQHLADVQDDQDKQAEQQPQTLPEVITPPWESYKISGVHLKGAVINGRNIEIGSTLHDLLLVGVDPEAGDTAWLGKDGASYRGRVGDVLRPGLLPDDIREQLARVARSLKDPAKAPETRTPPADINGP